MTAAATVTLWRPVGPAELELIKQSGMRAIPPRFAGTTDLLSSHHGSYAIKIARNWNVPASGSGYVTRFKVAKTFLDRYDVQTAGGKAFQEYWIPRRTCPPSMPQ